MWISVSGSATAGVGTNGRTMHKEGEGEVKHVNYAISYSSVGESELFACWNGIQKVTSTKTRARGETYLVLGGGVTHEGSVGALHVSLSELLLWSLPGSSEVVQVVDANDLAEAFLACGKRF